MFVVDFQVGALDPETIGLVGTPGEEIGEQPGEDAPGVGIVVVDYILAVTQNGVSFACAGLAVCENATIVSLRNQAHTSVLDLTASCPMY